MTSREKTQRKESGDGREKKLGERNNVEEK